MSACNVQSPLRPAQKKIRQKQVASGGNGRNMGSNRTAGVRFRCMHTSYQGHEGDELNQPNHRLVVLDTMTLDRLTCPTITPSGRVTKGRPGQARPCQPTTDPTGTGLGSLALWPRAAGKLPADLYLTANNGPGPTNHGCSIELLLRLVDTATTVVIPLHWRAIVPGECCYLLRGRHTRHEATVIPAVL